HTPRSSDPKRPLARSAANAIGGLIKKEWAPQLLSVLRVVIAFLFVQVGSAKWFAFPAAILPGGGTAPVGSLVWFAGVIEVIGGTFFFLGLFTRPAGFTLSREMAIASLMRHGRPGSCPLFHPGAPAGFCAFPLR